jgi:hypothetical protein
MSVFKQTATSKGANGETFEVPESGSQPAVLIGLIDLGTQVQKGYQGAADEDVHQVYLVFELTGAPMSGMKRNHTIGWCGRLSMHEKSKLRKLIEGWRGQKFGEGEEFDPNVLVGKPCMLNVVHETSKGSGNTYAKIDSISKIPKGMPTPKATLPTVVFEIGGATPIPDAEHLPYIFGTPVPEVVRRSREIAGGKVPAANGAATGGTTAPAQDDSDVIPF